MITNSVRILFVQSSVNIMCFYDIGLIEKPKNILEETTDRTRFLLYKNMFELEEKNIFNKLSKNVQE